MNQRAHNVLLILAYQKFQAKNILILKRMDLTLKVVPGFFETLVILTTNETLSTIFLDFLALYLVQTDLGKTLVGRSNCALIGGCDAKIYTDPVKYCTNLVRVHPAHLSQRQRGRVRFLSFSIMRTSCFPRPRTPSNGRA